MQIGIDFGTTRTVVAGSDRGNYPVVSFDAGGGESQEFFPSVLAEKDGELRCGFEALATRGMPGWTIRTSFKRLLSSPDATPGRRVKLGSSSFDLLDLVTQFLLALREQLRDHSNLPVADPDEELVATVSVPANAFSTQRLLTLEAFRRAGFTVVSMLNEPSAAGIEYAHRFRNTLTSQREKVLVYDLGGGTFDVSLVDMQAHQHNVMTSCGLSRLGGDDFDAELSNLALKRIGVDSQKLHVRSRARLRQHCRELKEAIGPNTRRLFVEVGACLQECDRKRWETAADHVEVLQASDYEAACRPLLAQTLELVERALKKTDGKKQLAGLYVVGGASALPVVTRTLRRHYSRRVHRSPYPSAAIAIGLAIAAAGQEKIEVKDRFHHNLGVFREKESGNTVGFDTIVGPNTPIPSAGAPPVAVIRRYQPTHNIGHFRFIECSWLDDTGRPSGDIKPFAEVRFPFEEKLQGKTDLETVSVTRSCGNAAAIEERYWLHATGAVELTIVDMRTGYTENHSIA